MIIEMLARRTALQLAPPTGFAITVAAAEQLNLSWTNASAAYQTEVWRDGVRVTTTLAGATSFPDTGVAAGNEYTYQIRHKSGSSYSPFGPALVRSATPPAPTLSGDDSDDDAVLSWSPVVSAINYRVYRSTTSGSGYSLIETTTNLTYPDETLANGTYYYVVRAYNGTYESANSNETGVVISFSPPLADPTGFSATPTHSDRINLSWTNGDGTAETEVYRSPTGSGSWTLLAPKSAGVTSHADEELSQTTTYYYRIRHVKGAQLSEYVTANGTTPTTSLTGITLTASTSTEEVTLSWTVTNPPQTVTVDLGDWSDTDRVVDVTARTDVGSSPVLVATYGNIVPSPTGVTVTGTLAYLRVRNGSGVLMDEVNNLTVDFDYEDIA